MFEVLQSGMDFTPLVDSILFVSFFGASVLHMAAYSKVAGQPNQSYRYCAQGQDQEQPDHPHDVLGYQKEVECAPEV